MHTQPGLGADLLRGAEAIADFLGADVKATFYKLEKRFIPAGKEGADWVASKIVLAAHYRQLVDPPMPPNHAWGRTDPNGVPLPHRGRPRKDRA
jgi:hypothetical protein